MAECILKERKQFNGDSFVEFRIYAVPKGKDFDDGVKYSMSFIRKCCCVLRHDNERGKGHHKHFNGRESMVKFGSINELKNKFLEEVAGIKGCEMK